MWRRGGGAGYGAGAGGVRVIKKKLQEQMELSISNIKDFITIIQIYVL